MEIKASDLRHGNIIMFHDVEEGDMPLAIDWQEIKAVTEEPERFNAYHKPIPLTEEILLKCEGAVCFDFDNGKPNQYQCGGRLLVIRSGKITDYGTCVQFDYVHHFQNFIYAITNKELKIKL